ncbi:MAG: hypothetical protein JNJ83_19115 [Verrucomicrobiaceae bacterium]|nr:hypothetical protein [Verrucomicrobiaceae bacterium]
MKSSLKQFILSPSGGYTRFLQGVDQARPQQDLSWLSDLPHRADSSLALGDTIDPEAVKAAHELRSQLSEALANTLLMSATPTRKAPTLRLAVEALRSA